ncbi:LysR substrate-binding domain-containing protein [soil metagenome]
MLDLRQIRYFLAVAEELSFRRAADRAAVSQPALSQRIKALEQDIGVALFDRTSRGVALTPAGEVFQRGARQILREVELAVSSTRLADRGESGSIAIAFNEIGGQQPLVGQCLGLFRSVFPNVAVQLSEMGTAAQREALRTGAVDAGFHYRVAGEGPDLSHRILDAQDFLLVMPEDHALARKPAVRLSDLAGEPMVRLRRDINADTHDGIVQALDAQGIVPDILLEASSDAAMLSLVAAGLGLAIVMGAERRGGWQGLALHRIEDLALTKQFVLAWNGANRSGPLAKFLALVDSAVERTPKGGAA